MPFDVIKDLTEFSANYRLEKINTLSGDRDSSDKAEQLYWLLRDNKELSQMEAAGTIYGEGEEENSNRFKMLKRRLVKRLSNTVFFLDNEQKNATDYRQGYVKAYREFAVAKILGVAGNGYAMIYFYQRVFKIASKYEITELILASAKVLRKIAGIYDKDTKRYYMYNEICTTNLIIFNAEAIAQSYHQEILFNYGASPKSRKKVVEISKRAIEELDSKFSFKTKTIIYAFSYYCIKLQGVEASDDIDGMIATANQAIEEVSTKEFNTNNTIIHFFFYKIVAYIQYRKYDEGFDILDEVRDCLIPHTTPWFKFQEFTYLLFAHTKRYSEAYQVYLKVVRSKKFNKLPSVMQQIWRLKRAYLYYLQKVGQVDISAEPDPLGKFRVNKFLNNVPEFSTDKSGMNIPVLSLQILISILERRYDISIERIEAIEKYTSRHIRRDEHFRSNCFIKALVQLPVAGFHRAAAARMGKRFIEKLKTEIINLSGQNYHVEVVPYDVLWPIALSSMEDKRWEGV